MPPFGNFVVERVIEMYERGKLVEKDGTQGLFELDVAGGCESCDIRHQCVSAGPGKRKIWLTIDAFDLNVGDEVEIETSPKSLLGAAFLVFLLPLIIAMVIYVGCYSLTKSQGVSLIGLLAGLVLAYFTISQIDRRWGKKKQFEPTLIRVLSD